MEAWLSWSVFIALSGALYWYYSQKDQHGRPRGRSLQRAPTTNTKAVDPSLWLDSSAKSKHAPKSTKVKAPRKSAKQTVQEVGNKAGAYVSGASSTADADDDLSPVTSPDLGAATAAKVPSGRDVSDMLESTGAAPAVLKINPSEKPARPNKPQQQRTESTQETKKQRQNRKKVEEAKAQREADEKERRALLEKQKRTAREARGEAAKNGLQSAQAPISNAWSKVRSPGAGATPTGNGQLLDTFDPDVVSTTSSSEAATNGTNPTPDSVSNSSHWSNLPTEDEQMRMAMAESEWSTVSSKAKKQRKNKVAGDTTEDGSDSGVTQAPAVKKVATKPVENVQPQSRFAALSEPVPNVGHPLDSDWAVA